jgi:iron complex outermembrane receptor protein
MHHDSSQPRRLPTKPRLAALTLRALLLVTSVGLTTTSSSLWAQTATGGVVSGRIQNAASGSYLNNVRVRVAGTNVEVFTNSFGEYRISNLPPGQTTLEVFYTGLETQKVPVTVPASGTAEQNISLKEVGAATQPDGTVLMKEFMVQSQRETDAAAIAVNEQRFAANRKDVISTDAFGDINQGNIGEFVKFIPGISLDVKDGNSPSGIMVRGFDPNYTNVTMDGGMLASTQIANTQTSSRGFLLEQANINNLSRIEVTKLPTPDMSANLLGGAVNFVSKSAFERSKASLNFNAYLSGNSNDLSLKKSPGPGNEDTYKVRPNFDMTYVKPISKTLGVVVNVAQSSQFYLQNKSVPGRRYFTGTNVNSSNFVSYQNNPQTLSMATSYNPNQIDRTSGSIKIDWKPIEHNVLSLSAGANANYQQNAGRTLTYNTGATVKSWDEHNTFGSTGATGTGTANESNSYQNRNGLLRYVIGNWTYTGNDWTVELAGSYSNSNNHTRDIAKGFWNALSTSLPNVKTVNLEGIDNSSGTVSKATVLDAAGNPINELKLSSYLLGKVTSQPQSNTDTVKDVRLNITRKLSIFGNQIGIKGGGQINDMVRDQHYTLWETTYAGPDGKLASGDETAAPFVDTRTSGTSPGFGRTGPEWIDPYLVYQAFQQHPNWFVRSASNEGDTVKNIAVRSPWLHETIKAGYLMADGKFLSNRLRVVGGVRYELTKDEGRGYKQDGNAIYQQDSKGHPIKGANGQYLLLPQFAGQTANNGSGEQNALIYQYRASYNSRDYGYYFPSLHTTYNLTENILLRAAYAETMGRPNVSDVVPTLFVGDNATFDPNVSSSFPGFITASNSELKPWTAKNYDYSLEYYMPHNGMVMFNWYKKDIRNFFSTQTQTADVALLDELGLSHDYVGYQYSTRINISDAMIKGWEINLNLPLQNLTSWNRLERFDSFARHFTLGLNTTHLELSGSRVTPSDWKRYIPRTRNATLRFNWGKVSGNVLLNFRGKMQRDTSSAINGLSSGGSEYIKARYQLDGNIDYQFSKHFAVYLAGRNILNAVSEWEVAGPSAVHYAATTNYEKYGVQYSLGVRGSF